jgi:hypothetical protein
VRIINTGRRCAPGAFLCQNPPQVFVPTALPHRTPSLVFTRRYYAEKVRQKTYSLDESEVKPYFPLDRMCEAIFDCAYQLFGLKFKLREDIASYHPDVQTYEVIAFPDMLAFLDQQALRYSALCGSTLTLNFAFLSAETLRSLQRTVTVLLAFRRHYISHVCYHFKMLMWFVFVIVLSRCASITSLASTTARTASWWPSSSTTTTPGPTKSPARGCPSIARSATTAQMGTHR